MLQPRLWFCSRQDFCCICPSHWDIYLRQIGTYVSRIGIGGDWKLDFYSIKIRNRAKLILLSFAVQLEQQETHAVTSPWANYIMSDDAILCTQCQTWHSMPILAFDTNLQQAFNAIKHWISYILYTKPQNHANFGIQCGSTDSMTNIAFNAKTDIVCECFRKSLT